MSWSQVADWIAGFSRSEEGSAARDDPQVFSKPGRTSEAKAGCPSRAPCPGVHVAETHGAPCHETLSLRFCDRSVITLGYRRASRWAPGESVKWQAHAHREAFGRIEGALPISGVRGKSIEQVGICFLKDREVTQCMLLEYVSDGTNGDAVS